MYTMKQYNLITFYQDDMGIMSDNPEISFDISIVYSKLKIYCNGDPKEFLSKYEG